MCRVDIDWVIVEQSRSWKLNFSEFGTEVVGVFMRGHRLVFEGMLNVEPNDDGLHVAHMQGMMEVPDDFDLEREMGEFCRTRGWTFGGSAGAPDRYADAIKRMLAGETRH